MQKNSPWRRRLRKALGYIQRRDWARLQQEIAQYLAWKGFPYLEKKRLSPGPTQPIVLWASTSSYRSSLWDNVLFDEFLEFERKVFGEEFPISAYDPYLIRYGEYRFALEMLSPQRGETIADLGCESNIFILYLAYLGARVLAIDLNPLVGDELQHKIKRAEEATGRKFDIHLEVQDVT
jgi:2-polyprenyl-3-methyl-5-hydroxy-6-metoxy-1,4-benzoquinol methylase